MSRFQLFFKSLVKKHNRAAVLNTKSRFRCASNLFQFFFILKADQLINKVSKCIKIDKVHLGLGFISLKN
jgi:hypothetical protein